MSISATRPVRPLTGRRFFLILASCFAVVFVVNGVMAYLALSTFSGLDGDDSYRAGLNYNQTIAHAEQQSALGWSVNIAGEPARRGLALQVLDKGGSPVAGLTVTGTLGRPSTDRFDTPIAFKESEPGRYLAALSTPAEAGTWVVSLAATPSADGGKSAFYQIKQRLWLK